ncbi:Response regulator receiver domain-containing protein [Verrucomicrobium sp. GAS474]|uniref:response regulator n=1 Tax=Verrucomicrobium sp. GAS474 TaxID=1882831 RepID=UPI00087BD58C|nr:response regulator [Verrucomicrobium sp. GAS474]SDT95313.1 Response regulator receiver domain-containing protein [Verrucomicrobium sp. GAS474]
MENPFVLYVEDEPDDVVFMRLAFKKVGADERLHVLDDGQKAIDYLREAARAGRPPALILLDLNLPTVSGFDVLIWIRNQERLRHLPVLIFSSSGRIEDRVRAKDLGADDYALKPMSLAHFVGLAEEIVRQWLKPKADAAPPVTPPSRS